MGVKRSLQEGQQAREDPLDLLFPLGRDLEEPGGWVGVRASRVCPAERLERDVLEYVLCICDTQAHGHDKALQPIGLCQKCLQQGTSSALPAGRLNTTAILVWRWVHLILPSPLVAQYNARAWRGVDGFRIPCGMWLQIHGQLGYHTGVFEEPRLT
jgi:hypothetical protein